MISHRLFSRILSFFTIILACELIIAVNAPASDFGEQPAPLISPTVSLTPNRLPTPKVDKGIKKSLNKTNLVTQNQVIVYTVSSTDTIKSIALRFGVTEASIVGGNVEKLYNNPIRMGMEINILPVSGIYYTWVTGDTPLGVASFFGIRFSGRLTVLLSHRNTQGGMVSRWTSTGSR